MHISTTRVLTAALSLVPLIACASPRPYAPRQFGKEPMRSLRWPDALNELVNSPERVAGKTSFGQTEFYFNGDVKAINRLIVSYAKLDQPYIYVAIKGDYRAALQIRQNGDDRHCLTVYVNDLEQLKGLELPPKVTVEWLPPFSVSLDFAIKAAEQQLWESVQASGKEHDAKQRDATQRKLYRLRAEK